MSKEHQFQKYLPKGTSPTVSGNLVLYEISENALVSVCEALVAEGFVLKLITARDERKETDFFSITYIFGKPKESLFLAPFIRVTDSFPSLTLSFHQASIYERKIYSMFGLIPQGHPNLRTLILHDENWPELQFPLRKDVAWNIRPEISHGTFPFRKIGGEGIYEIPVGPVHAGIIEPGHFRFSVAGEEILHLEPRLGYSHKGTEKLFEIIPLDEKIRLAERISGDSSFSHSLAFCLAVEHLCDREVSENTHYLRVIFCELERLANHLGDMGAIMLDTGFNFGGSNGARLREMIMRMVSDLCGNRFMRGINTIGALRITINREQMIKLASELESIKKDFSQVMHIAENNSSLIERLQKTGTLAKDVARDHGVVGVAARACGFDIDTRIDFPYAAYKNLNFGIALEQSADVYARFYVRLKEVYTSFDILQEVLATLDSIHAVSEQRVPSLKKNTCAVGVVEGWRGEIITFVATDAKGIIDRVEVRDPSFLNWTVLGHAGKGNMVPDFPLINKSFNLSYSGNDL